MVRVPYDTAGENAGESRGAIKFPDLVRSVKIEADRGYPQAGSAHDTFWDFVSLMPESLHTVIWAVSDRAISWSLQMMEGFGVYTFNFVNEGGEAAFVKLHWRPVLGMQSLIWDESAKLQGADNCYHRRDLYEAIAAGDFPEWDFAVQVFDQQLADSLPWDVLDPTKIIPEEIVPLRVIGRMVLNRNPDNHFSENEQSAFLPSNIVPGIDFSDDPLLQWWLFSYLDTQKSRLGTTNFHHNPANAPKCPFANMMRDGLMQTHVPKDRANCEPNSLDQTGEDPGPRASAEGFTTAPLAVPGDKLRIRPESFGDHYSHPRMYWRSLSENEQVHTASAFVFVLSKVGLDHVRARVLSHLRVIDNDLGARVARGLGIELPDAAKPFRAPLDLAPSGALSIQKNWKATLKGRKIGLLIDEGSDKDGIDKLTQAIKAEGGSVFTIASKVGPLKLKGGRIIPDGQLAGMPSVLFDAGAMILMPDQAEKLARDSAAVGFVMDAWAHLNAIGHCKGSAVIFARAGIEDDERVGPWKDLPETAKHRYWAREAGLRGLA